MRHSQAIRLLILSQHVWQMKKEHFVNSDDKIQMRIVSKYIFSLPFIIPIGKEGRAMNCGKHLLPLTQPPLPMLRVELLPK